MSLKSYSVCFRKMWTGFSAATVAVAFVAVALMTVDLCGQQQQQQPMEYIESSSPLPGGGVVSSVYMPGQRGPVYRQVPGGQPNLANNTSPSTSGTGSGSGQSVLDQSLAPSAGQTNTQGVNSQGSAPRVASNNLGVTTYQLPIQNPQVTNAFQVPAASQIPSLGVPTQWNRAIRSGGCGTCGPGAGVVPFGLGQQSQPATAFSQGQFAPQVQNYFQQPQQRTTYTPLFQLQQFPVNAYAGQGILGSPKLYVDGQPIRNLMRYLWIP